KNPESLEEAKTSENFWTKALVEYKLIGPHPPEEKLIAFEQFFSSKLYQDEFARYNEAIYAAIEMCKPDLIYSDSNTTPPAVHYSGIPWIKNISVTPIFFEIDDEL